MSRKLGPYVLLEMLHRDWLGVCHAALDTDSGRRVSLRVLAGGIGEHAASVAALRQALRCSPDRIHANVATVYDVGEAAFEPAAEEARACYVASELLQGKRLSALLSDGGLDARRAHVVMSQILLGLGCAHRLGMIHADLNPSNVLVQGGDEVTLLEVGLCAGTIWTGVDASTSAGWPLFIAPEQLLGEPATVRSDLRAAGVLLYRMLAGCDPFQGSPALAMQKVLTEDLPPLSQLRPGLGRHFDHVIAKATARRAEQRFQSAEEFLHALNRAGFDASAAGTGMVTGTDTGTAAAGWSAMESDARELLATALRDAVGPIAPILLANALRESSSAAHCRAVLAAQISEAQARESFLQATLDAPADSAAPAGPGSAPAVRDEWPLAVTRLRQLVARLSEEIGPMATLLVERASAQANSREEFIARMTEVLPAGIVSEAWRAELGAPLNLPPRR